MIPLNLSNFLEEALEVGLLKNQIFCSALIGDVWYWDL